MHRETSKPATGGTALKTTVNNVIVSTFAHSVGETVTLHVIAGLLAYNVLIAVTALSRPINLAAFRPL